MQFSIFMIHSPKMNILSSPPPPNPLTTICTSSCKSYSCIQGHHLPLCLETSRKYLYFFFYLHSISLTIPLAKQVFKEYFSDYFPCYSLTSIFFFLETEPSSRADLLWPWSLSTSSPTATHFTVGNHQNISSLSSLHRSLQHQPVLHI